MAPPAATSSEPVTPPPLTATSRQHYFSVIALNFSDTTALDHRIATEIHNSRYYHTVAVVPYYIGTTEGTYIIYRYEPPK